MRDLLEQHGETIDVMKVAMANGASLAISATDVETCLSIAVMLATLVYTVLKIRAHTCKKCRLGGKSNKKG